MLGDVIRVRFNFKVGTLDVNKTTALGFYSVKWPRHRPRVDTQLSVYRFRVVKFKARLDSDGP